MFERFTNEARRVVVLATEEARLQNRDCIGTEHLLLGLIHQEEGVGAKVLESLGVSLEAVRGEVEQITGPGAGTPAGYIPFTARAKKALDLSVREAFQLGHDEVGTEHILLGLLREGEGVAAQVLATLGADLTRTRQEVMQFTPGDAPRTHRMTVMRTTVGHEVPFPDARWSERAEHFLMCHRRMPRFLIGWPTWFGNRKASGIREIPGDLAYLRDSLFKRGDYRD